MHKGNTILFMLLFFVLFGLQSFACTSFQFKHKNQLIVGKNLDWEFDQGLVIINKKNIAKKAWVKQGENPMEWVSIYGSITFNHLGKEFPLGGMNEKGLVIEEMNYWESKYPDRDERKALNELQWIQYQLDNSQNIKDVIATDKKIRIAKHLFNIHYLVADRDGNTAIIEFYNGRMRVYKNADYPVTVLANNAYETSLKGLPYFEEFGGDIPIGNNYANRFFRTWKMLQDYKGEQPIIDYSFAILESIKDSSETKWSIVYDQKNLKIYFKTQAKPKFKSVSLNAFKFSSREPSLYVNINLNEIGKINDCFVEYKSFMNNKLLEEVYHDFAQVGLIAADQTDSLIQQQTKYTEDSFCTKKKKKKLKLINI